jgi:hypothetical protein
MRRLLIIPALLVVAAIFTPPAAEGTGKVITIGTEVTGNLVPWRGQGVGMRFQCLWHQADIKYAGFVNAVEFKYSSGHNSGAFNNVRVWLCHTNKSALEAAFDNNYGGNTPTQVLDKLTVTLSGTGWLDIGIDPNKFNYNNRDNLLMEIRWKGSSGNSIYCKIYDATGGRCYAFNDAASSGTVVDEGQYIRLHVDTMPGVEPTSLGRVRALYR